MRAFRTLQTPTTNVENTGACSHDPARQGWETKSCSTECGGVSRSDSDTELPLCLSRRNDQWSGRRSRQAQSARSLFSRWLTYNPGCFPIFYSHIGANETKESFAFVPSCV